MYIHSSTVNVRYYAPLTSLFFQQYFEALFRCMPQDDDLDISFILDEAPLLKIDLDVIAANIRKYRGNLMVICQDAEAQLTATFGRERAQAILSNLGTKVYLDASFETAQKLQQELGRYEYEDKKSGHVRSRDLMTADEIRNLSTDRALITVAGKRPVIAKLTPYYLNRELLRRTELPPATGYSKQKDGEAAEAQLLDIGQYLESLHTPTPKTDTDG